MFSRRKQTVGPGDPADPDQADSRESVGEGVDLTDTLVMDRADGPVAEPESAGGAGPDSDEIDLRDEDPSQADSDSDSEVVGTDSTAGAESGDPDEGGPVVSDRLREVRASLQDAAGTWRKSAGDLVTEDDRATLSRVRSAIILSDDSWQRTRLPAWLLAPLWVAGVGLLLSLVGLLLLAGMLSQSMWSGPVLAWLVAHQSTLITPDGSISLLPLGLTAIPVLLWARASAWLGHRFDDDPRELRRNRMLAVVSYGILCLLGALLVLPGEIRVSLLTTVVAGPAVAGLGIAVSLWWRDRSPSRIPTALLGGVTAAGWFVVLGTGVLTVLVIVNFTEVGAVRSVIAQGPFDQLALLLVELAYLPNLILWAAAYATGAGISAGGDQIFSPLTVGSTSLPELPVLAAFPSEPPGWAAFLPILVVGGGWFAVIVQQRRAQARNVRHRLARTLVLTALVAMGWLVALLLAGGSLGDGRLSYVGPAVTTPLFAAGLMWIGALVWALLPTLAADLRMLVKRGRRAVSRRRSSQ